MEDDFLRASRVPNQGGMCKNGNDYYHSVRLHSKTPKDLAKLSFQEDGFKVLMGVEDALAGAPGAPGVEDALAGAPGAPDLPLPSCKQEIWTALKGHLIDQGPKCWRKQRYYGRCEHFSSEAECDGATGCQWNPPIDVVLLSEVARTEKFKEDMKPNRENLDMLTEAVIHTNSLQRDIFEARIPTWTQIKGGVDAKPVVVPVLFRHTEYINMETQIQKQLETHSAVFRRSPLNEAKQNTFLAAMKAQGIPGEHVVVGTPSTCTMAPGENKHSFSPVHNDFVLWGLRVFYETVMRLDANRDASQDSEGKEEQRYYLEMANFWAPLERRTMAVNFLGFRVRKDSANPDSPGPADFGGFHGCPAIGSEPVDFWYAALEFGQGYLFRTRYQHHANFELRVLDLDKERNCRTSIEFRFMYIGREPLRKYNTQQDSLFRTSSGANQDKSLESIRTAGELAALKAVHADRARKRQAIAKRKTGTLQAERTDYGTDSTPSPVSVDQRIAHGDAPLPEDPKCRKGVVDPGIPVDF